MFNKLINYTAIKRAKQGDLHRLKQDFAKVLRSGINEINGSDIKSQVTPIMFSVLDTACVHDGFRNEFLRNLKLYGVIDDNFIKKIRKYTDEEREMMQVQVYAVNPVTGEINTDKATKFKLALGEAKKAESEDERIAKFSDLTKENKTFAINPDAFLETNILPLLEGLIRTSPTLSRVSMLSGVEFKQLIEFGEEVDAQTLAKGAAGTEADDSTRTSLLLNTNNKKIQASTRINRRDLMNLDPSEWAQFVARLVNRVIWQMENQIYYATGSSNQWQRGLYNTAGSDSTNMIGALTVSGLSGNLIDKLKQMDKDLSTLTSASEEAMYTYSVNRKLMADLKIAKDLNGNYYFPAGADIQVNNHSFVVSPAINDNDVFLSPLPYFSVVMAEEMNLMNDQGLVNIKEDEIIYVSRIYADGTPRKAFKRRVGATTDNNQQQNYHRYGNIA